MLLNFLNFSLNTLFFPIQYQHRGRQLLSKYIIRFKILSLTDINIYFYLITSEALTLFPSKVKGYVKELVISFCS